MNCFCQLILISYIRNKRQVKSRKEKTCNAELGLRDEKWYRFPGKAETLIGPARVKFAKQKIIYIGSTGNIRKRLREHLGKNGKNGHIRDFLKKGGCSFRYMQLSKDWKEEEKRLYNLFHTTYGAPPRCNRVRP